MKRTYSRIGFVLLVFGVVTFAGQFLTGIILGLLSEFFPGIINETVIMWIGNFLPLYLIGAPIFLLLMRRIPVEPYEEKPLGAGNFIAFLLICFPVMYGGSILGNLLSMVLSGGAGENPLMDYIFDSVFLRILVMVIAAPLIEELVFRKQILDRTVQYGEKTAIFFSAMTFGLFHMNLYQFFYAWGIGLVLAYVYVRTRKLRYSVLMHMIINFMGGVIAPWVLTAIDVEAVAELDPYTISESALMELLPGLLIYSGYVILLLGLSVAGIVLLIVKGSQSSFLKNGERLQWKTVYGNGGVICYVVFCIIFCVLALFMT